MSSLNKHRGPTAIDEILLESAGCHCHAWRSIRWEGFASEAWRVTKPLSPLVTPSLGQKMPVLTLEVPTTPKGWKAPEDGPSTISGASSVISYFVSNIESFAMQRQYRESFFQSAAPTFPLLEERFITLHLTRKRSCGRKRNANFEMLLRMGTWRMISAWVTKKSRQSY